MKSLPYLTLAVVLLAQAAAPAPAAAGGIRTDGQIVSTVPPGTPPLQVASPDRVENLNADLLDGFHAGSFRFQDEIRVGGFGTGEFSSIQEAIDSLSTPLLKHVLIHVGPGHFKERVVLPDRVHLRGSGKGLTVIIHPGADTFDAAAATLVLGNWTRVSDLTVTSGTDHNYNIGIYNPPGTLGPIVEDVEVSIVSSAAPSLIGILNGDAARLIVEDSEVLAHNGGAGFTYAIWNHGHLKFRHGRMRSWNGDSIGAGLINVGVESGGFVQIEHSTLEANPAILDDDEFGTVLILSRATGSVDSSVTCDGVVVQNVFHASTCS